MPDAPHAWLPPQPCVSPASLWPACALSLQQDLRAAAEAGAATGLDPLGARVPWSWPWKWLQALPSRPCPQRLCQGHGSELGGLAHKHTRAHMWAQARGHSHKVHPTTWHAYTPTPAHDNRHARSHTGTLQPHARGSTRATHTHTKTCAQTHTRVHTTHRNTAHVHTNKHRHADAHRHVILHTHVQCVSTCTRPVPPGLSAPCSSQLVSVALFPVQGPLQSWASVTDRRRQGAIVTEGDVDPDRGP